MQTAIERRIEEFLQSNDAKLEWLKPVVRQHSFLPLYLGWTAALGVQPDGAFVRWDHEDESGTVRPLSEPYLQRLAITQGAKKYPELTV